MTAPKMMFASGSAAYYQDLDSKDVPNAIAAHWAEVRSLSASALNPKQQFELETHKGVIFLDTDSGLREHPYLQ